MAHSRGTHGDPASQGGFGEPGATQAGEAGVADEKYIQGAFMRGETQGGEKAVLHEPPDEDEVGSPAGISFKHTE